MDEQQQRKVYCEDCEHMLGGNLDVPCCAVRPQREFRKFVRRKWNYADAAPCSTSNTNGDCRLFVRGPRSKPSWWRRLVGKL